MKVVTKRKIKNGVNPEKKYILNGIMMKGKGLLKVKEIESRGIHSVSENRNVRSLVTKTGTIVADVDFPAPSIVLTGLKYMIDNCAFGHNVSAVDALIDTFRTSEEVMHQVLDVADDKSVLKTPDKSAIDR